MKIKNCLKGNIIEYDGRKWEVIGKRWNRVIARSLPHGIEEAYILEDTEVNLVKENASNMGAKEVMPQE